MEQMTRSHSRKLGEVKHDYALFPETLFSARLLAAFSGAEISLTGNARAM